MTVFGGRERNRYLLETTGCGAAFFDYDGDGWLDVFLVNGTTLEGFPAEPGADEPPLPQPRRRDASRTSPPGRASRRAAGARASASATTTTTGTRTCSSRYYGQNRLYHNRGDGTFEDVTARAGLTETRLRWGTGCAFLDYDRDGRLDLFVANYIDLDLEDRRPCPSRACAATRAMPVACGPPGLVGGKNVLYHNRGTARSRTSPRRRASPRAGGTYGLGVSTLDFDDDGWTDIYVANDSNPCALYRNRPRRDLRGHRGRARAAPTARTARPRRAWASRIGDYDRNGTHGHLQDELRGRHRRRSTPTAATASARTGRSRAASGVNTRWLGWGVGFVDLDNDGWLDLFLVNGHVYPEVVADPDRGELQAAQGRLPEPRRRRASRTSPSGWARR